jgi:hypothetical protein
MRAFVLLLLATSSVACKEQAPSVGEVRFQGTSDFELQDVARCVSQDINSAFPRLFSAGESANHKAFRSYNGLNIDLQKFEKSVSLELRWSLPLNADQEEYLKFCLDRAYEAR